MKNLTISVIGLGYIGLPTAALLANNGYSVVGMDVSEHAVNTINQGDIHIIEPDLDAFVRSAVAAGRLRAFTEPQPGDVYIICVPTPFHEGSGIPKPNIDFVLAAMRSISPFVKSGDLVILESTSPVGTTEQMRAVLREAGVDVDSIHMAYCPERVLPGKIMTELVENDRIVGGVTETATKAVADFYSTFVRGHVLETDAKTAEMCKLTENSFRDVNIAFANELSLICDKEGINVWNLINLANHHPRVNILQPGTGVGGHCIAVDPWFIAARDEENSKMIQTARGVNNFKTEWVVEKIKAAAAEYVSKSGEHPKIACLGLAFKPDVDDLRHSPALKVAKDLIDLKYDVVAVEPNIVKHSTIDLKGLNQAMQDCGVLAILVKHKDFIGLKMPQNNVNCIVLDFCGTLDQG